MRPVKLRDGPGSRMRALLFIRVSLIKSANSGQNLRERKMFLEVIDCGKDVYFVLFALGLLSH